MRYIDRLKAELAEVRSSRGDLIANGQSVNVQGSHSYTKLRLAELNKEEARLMRLIAAAEGVSTRRSEVPYYG